MSANKAVNTMTPMIPIVTHGTSGGVLRPHAVFPADTVSDEIALVFISVYQPLIANARIQIRI